MTNNHLEVASQPTRREIQAQRHDRPSVEQPTGQDRAQEKLSFHLVDFLIIETAAIVLRTWMWATQPGVWYFPDSNIYIYAHQYPKYASSRPGAISTLWYYMTLGVFDEKALVVMQFVAGLVAVAMVYDMLRRIAHRYGALVVSLIFALFPMTAIYERSAMTEALALDFLVGGFWGLTLALRSNKWWFRLTGVVMSLGFFGLSAVVRSALVIPIVAVVAVAGVVWFIREQAGRINPWVVLRSIGALAIGGLLFIAPLEAQMNAAETSVGMHSLNPLTGSFLAARWTQIMPCTSPDATLKLVKRVLKELCIDTRFTHGVPGYSMNLVWYAHLPIGKTVFVNHNFPVVEKELQTIAMKAIEQHPSFVVASMSSVVVNELFGTPYVDARDYNNGYKLFTYSSFKHHPEVLKHFLQVSSKPVEGTYPFLESLAISTARWPQYLLWLVLLGLVARSAWWLFGMVRKGRSHATRSQVQRSYLWGRATMVAAAWIFLVVYVLGVAFSAFAVFRYNLMLMPSLSILLACVWTRPVNLDPNGEDDDHEASNSMELSAQASALLPH